LGKGWGGGSGKGGQINGGGRGGGNKNPAQKINIFPFLIKKEELRNGFPVSMEGAGERNGLILRRIVRVSGLNGLLLALSLKPLFSTTAVFPPCDAHFCS
jgi:hypothetical protein